MSTADFEDAGFVLASSYREEVLEALDDSPGTPSGLRDRTGYELAHVSRSLGKLRERELVALLVPEETKKGRVYGLTDYGTEVLEQVRLVDGGNGA